MVCRAAVTPRSKLIQKLSVQRDLDKSGSWSTDTVQTGAEDGSFHVGHKASDLLTLHH
jgi:hypothetical protein